MSAPFRIVRPADESDALRSLGFTRRYHELRRMQDHRRRLRVRRATRFPLRWPGNASLYLPLRGPRR